MKKVIPFLLVCIAFTFSANAQMTIGANTTPATGAVLDLVSPPSPNQLGLYLPRVSLSGAITTWGLTGAAPATGGMMVYNTNSAFAGTGMGIYYWDGAKWNFVANASTSTITADNGVTMSTPTNVQLGGTLTHATTITTTPAYSLNLVGGGAMNINANSLPSGSAALGITSTAGTPGSTVTGINSSIAGPNTTNIGATFSASGATNNYGLIVSNGQIGFGTAAPSASAALQISSINKGILLPSVSTAQETAIPAPATSLIVYNNTTGCLDFYVGGKWQPIGCACTSAPATPGTITSSDPALALCPNTPHTFSIAPVAGAATYTWTASSSLGSNLDGTGSNTESTSSTTIQAAFTTGGFGTITVVAVNACGTSVGTSTLNIGVTPAPAAPVFSVAPVNVCSGTPYTYTISAVPYATTYTWDGPAGATINGFSPPYTTASTSVTVIFASTTVLNSPGTVTVYANNNCGTSSTTSATVSMNSIPAIPVFNLDPTPVCSGISNTYSVNPITNAVSYTWTAGTGAITFNATASPYTTPLNSLGVIFPASPATNSFTVKATNTCGSSTAQSSGTITVNSVPGSPSSITGTTTYCSTPNLNTYSITGLPTNAVTVTWTGPAGSNVNGTGTNTYTGTATTITVDFGTAVAGGKISVYGTDGCGNGATVTTAALNPLAVPTVGTISGTNPVCSGGSGTYTLSSATNATSYTWTVPAGDIITTGGNTTNTYTEATLTSITVNPWTAAGNVTVTASNCNGSTSATPLAVTLSNVPTFPVGASITALTSSAAPYPADPGPYWENQVVVFTVSPAATGATGYSWTVPTNATITSGGTTTSITVNLGKFTGTGNVTVVATNSCGNSTSVTLSISSCYAPGSASYAYTTGSVQSFSVPSCVTQITATLAGAQGGMAYSTHIGGAALSAGLNGGGITKSVVSVLPGTALNIYVGGHGLSGTSNTTGGAGGINGSGFGTGGNTITTPATAYASGAGGGASSEIWVAGTRALVAGGGGGGGVDFYINFVAVAYAGGAGGSTTAANGAGGGPSTNTYVGKGATQAAPGAGGSVIGTYGGTAGVAGAGSIGGNGGNNDYAGNYSGAGGGGGGWFGGGGGNDAGGGGGSSNYQNATNFIPAAPTYTLNGNVAYNVSTGVDGYILITW